jgi:hypothetical protein
VLTRLLAPSWWWGGAPLCLCTNKQTARREVYSYLLCFAHKILFCKIYLVAGLEFLSSLATKVVVHKENGAVEAEEEREGVEEAHTPDGI